MDSGSRNCRMQEGEQGEASVEMGFLRIQHVSKKVLTFFTSRIRPLPTLYKTKLNASVIEVRKFRMTFFTKKEH